MKRLYRVNPVHTLNAWHFAKVLHVVSSGSLTEIVQIIGCCTRDSKGKEHAQFTNLIAAPDETQDDVVVAVNDMLKAITASLLMEQVMAPKWNFKTSLDPSEEGENKGRNIVVEGLKLLGTERARQIVEEQMDDLKAGILQHPLIREAIEGVAPEIINKVYIPKIVEELHPELTEDEVEAVSHRVVLDFVLKGKDITAEDLPQGWIYILRSKSEDERIASVKDLYKIGFTTNPVEERIKNAKNEPTYLMADVEVVATYKVYNANVHKLEGLLHDFFHTARFYVCINGVNPEEWFVVPLPIIREAIVKFIDGSIVDYIYNREHQALEGV